MATAISSAFQSNTAEDENSLKPSRAAPPIPSVAYQSIAAARAPEQGERPIYQGNTEQIRHQHLQQQQQLHQQQAQQQQKQLQQQQYHQQQQQQQSQQPQYAQQQQPPQSSPSQQPQYHYYPQPRSQQLQQAPSTLGSRPSTQHTNFSQPQQTPRGRQEPGFSSQQQETTIPPVQQKKQRSNSFSFLRRSSSQNPAARAALVQQQQQAAAANYPTGAAATAAAVVVASGRKSSGGHQPQPSDGSVSSQSTSLFRGRSRDNKQDRNMLRKQSKLKQQQQLEELERQRRAAEAANRPPPRLPQPAPLPGIDTFGGENNVNRDSDVSSSYPPQSPPTTSSGAAANFSRPSAATRNSAKSPPVANGGDYYEPSGERSSSMTNRGRYSYASSTAHVGSVNSPRRVRRRKDPTPFNVLVIGTKNSGKTSFISFLRNSLALRGDKQDPSMNAQPPTRSTFTQQYLETEIDAERVGVTLWDSAGLEKNIVDLQLREMTAFIESKFEDTFSEEQKVVRSPGFRDTHIHCVFLVLDPIRLDSNVLAASSAGRTAGGLDEDVDLQVLRALFGKTTVIPVISKADTLTTNHMTFLKRAVWQSVKAAKLNPLDALEVDDDDDLDEDDEEDEDESEYDDGFRGDAYEAEGPTSKSKKSHNRTSSLSSTISDEDPYIPMSILSPDPYSMPPYTKYAPKSQSEIGRRYAWGFASPFDPQHCDFIRLRETIFTEWRADLRELSRVRWYEQWRTSRLRHAPQSMSKRAGVSSSGSQALPFRDAGDRQQSGRSVHAQQQSVASRNPPLHTQQMPTQPQVGMAVTTPGGMTDGRY